MNPLPKTAGGSYSGPFIGEQKRDGPVVLEVPGYGIDHTVVPGNDGLQRAFRPATIVVDRSGFQQLGGFLSFDELDQALGVKVGDGERKFGDQNVIIDSNNRFYAQPRSIPPADPQWANAAAGLKELMQPPKKHKAKPHKYYETPAMMRKDGLLKADQHWKLIQPGKYWPCLCFPLITIRKPVLIPEHPETHRLQTTLPVQILQKVPKDRYGVENFSIPNPELTKPIKGELKIPAAMVDNREIIAASTLSVPLQAKIPTTYGTLQIPISTVEITQQQSLTPTYSNEGYNLINAHNMRPGALGGIGYSA